MSSEHSPFQARNIDFPNGNRAVSVLTSKNMRPQEVLPLLGIPAFEALIMLVGGAGSMDEELFPHLRNMFTNCLADFATNSKALIIDGGTDAGVMRLMGQGRAQRNHTFPLLGVSPSNLVTFSGKKNEKKAEELAELDQNHSHFVLVEADTWGGETDFMYQLAHLYAKEHPSIALVVNGGSVATKEVLYNVRQQRPIVLLVGSGRLADKLAALWQEKPSTFEQQDIGEIIEHGNIRLFPIDGSSEEFTELLKSLL